VDVVADSFAVTLGFGTVIVPAVLGGSPFREPIPTPVTEEVPILAVVPVKVEFEFGAECPLAVTAGMWHRKSYRVLS
jgi:hypothetical protein